MLKLFCVSRVVIALLLLLHLQQSTEAFKIIKILNKQGGGGSHASSAVAAPVLDAGTLLKGVTDAVSTKLNLISSLASSVLQLKRNVKQNLLTTIMGKFNHPNSLTTTHAKPFLTKNVNFGVGGGVAGAAAPGYTY